jgi:hypothetical protein
MCTISYEMVKLTKKSTFTRKTFYSIGSGANRLKLFFRVLSPISTNMLSRKLHQKITALGLSANTLKITGVSYDH